MNEAMTSNMTVINSLNKVEGFEPAAFLRRLAGENGEEQFYLDVKYRKLWFRLLHPEGKITKRIIRLENDFAIIESKVYLHRNDPEDAYVSCAFAQRWRKDEDAYGLKYVETAETAAVGRALADAGFGIQFSEPGEERDTSLVDAPVTIPEAASASIPDEADEELPEEKTIEKENTVQKATRAKGKEPDESMSVEELMRVMSLKEAKNYVIPIGAYKGKTLGELCVEKPGAINWYVDSYNGNKNMLRAAAKILLAAAQ
ncbi:hypothetical protein DW773_09225 [Firmicutes bacterium AM29-6AC]|jgi:hypothetical protein|uniref:Uncharacterized protein n=1 Tax=Anaerotignum faecicola TaxID=2358141 RepID=A0A401LA94_9FIRM|nr:hypothetical protein [Anaerotignum faecicola]RHR13756.1 hypothetical protein DWX47_09390 [Firmicutes bacterium AF19-2LB]RHT39468.1 hypothetical protein DW773_09225 [Firmicutes bacterium AM29-6AC]GCB28448.1 hypothetical protein KGMB03357_01090 [Anaerotignum faecicola]